MTSHASTLSSSVEQTKVWTTHEDRTAPCLRSRTTRTRTRDSRRFILRRRTVTKMSSNGSSNTPEPYPTSKTQTERSVRDLYSVRVSGRDVAADVLLGSATRQTALHKAALKGHLDVCRFLLSRQVDVNATDHDGWAASRAHFSRRFRFSSAGIK